MTSCVRHNVYEKKPESKSLSVSLETMADFRGQLIEIAKLDAVAHTDMKKLMTGTIEHLMAVLRQPDATTPCLFMAAFDLLPKSGTLCISDKQFHELMKTRDDRFLGICSEIYEWEYMYNKADVDFRSKQVTALKLLPKVINVCKIWKPQSKSSASTDPEDPMKRWQLYKNIALQTLTQISKVRDNISDKHVLNLVNDILQFASSSITSKGLTGEINYPILAKINRYIVSHGHDRCESWETIIAEQHKFPGPDSFKAALFATMTDITHDNEHKLRQLIKLLNKFATEEIERIQADVAERKAAADQKAIKVYPEVVKKLQQATEDNKKFQLITENQSAQILKQSETITALQKQINALKQQPSADECKKVERLILENKHLQEQNHDKSLEINHLEATIQQLKLDTVEMQMDLDKFERKHAAAEAKAQTLEAAFHMLCNGTSVTLHTDETPN